MADIYIVSIIYEYILFTEYIKHRFRQIRHEYECGQFTLFTFYYSPELYYVNDFS